jgi:hypothetical protein
MSKQTPTELDPKRFDKWRNALKKKDVNAFNPMPQPVPKAPKPYDFNITTTPIAPIPANPHIDYSRDVWEIKFPKIAEDLIDETVFKNNVIRAVKLFLDLHIPLEKNVIPGVHMSMGAVTITTSGYGHYPSIVFQPVFSGLNDEVKDFLKPFQQWSGHELYWKGSFLKNKTDGKIIGMRLTDLAYTVPDQFYHGQPKSYIEHTLL